MSTSYLVIFSQDNEKHRVSENKATSLIQSYKGPKLPSTSLLTV